MGDSEQTAAVGGELDIFSGSWEAELQAMGQALAMTIFLANSGGGILIGSIESSMFNSGLNGEANGHDFTAVSTIEFMGQKVELQFAGAVDETGRAMSGTIKTNSPMLPELPFTATKKD